MNVHPLVYIPLFVAAVLVFTPLYIIGFFYPFWKFFFYPIMRLQRPTYSFKKHFLPIFKVVALIKDQLANAIAGAFLNDVLIKKDPRFEYNKKAYKHGDTQDTISEVIGVNETRGALTKFGLMVTKILSIVLNDNHSIKAIKPNRQYPPHTKV